MIDGGYPRIDSLTQQMPALKGYPQKITVAPTWGEGSLIEHELGMDILDSVIKSGFDVYLRLHPMTVRHCPDLIKKNKK